MLDTANTTPQIRVKLDTSGLSRSSSSTLSVSSPGKAKAPERPKRTSSTPRWMHAHQRGFDAETPSPLELSHMGVAKEMAHAQKHTSMTRPTL